MANIFAIVQVILQALNLWDALLDFMAANHSKEIEERRQRQEQAIDDAAKAKTPEEAWDAQERIVDNEPSP